MSSFCVEKNTRISGGFSLKLVFGFPSWPGDKQLSCFFFFFFAVSDNPGSWMAIFNGLFCNKILCFLSFFFSFLMLLRISHFWKRKFTSLRSSGKSQRLYGFVDLTAHSTVHQVCHSVNTTHRFLLFFLKCWVAVLGHYLKLCCCFLT